eukprot:TRINITY_DN9341_c0_g1_i1.p1 TRINITY_DN9341_c0_g1~~TRINITY_DN9341_c0_g1_i1.p1  ORF type:complete len:1125 (+),score=284.99 TRINITY_DN9341_c0_g1_i1:308-3376(+)
MEGDRVRGSRNAGVIPRAVHHIFSELDRADTEYTITVSYIELYNEELHDLLATSTLQPGEKKQLRILEDPTRGTQLQGLEEVLVKSSDEIFNILDTAYLRRITAETAMNANSSRSHGVFTVNLHIRETTPDGEELLKVGKLNLVDLAGSENIGRSKAKDQRAREAGMINQSLLTLGRVITALTDYSPHIPYRESKLTRLLQDSLGGRTKTCIVATVSPAHLSVDETLSTLDYAHRAKSIKNKPEVNQKVSKTVVMKDFVHEIAKLKAELQAAREKQGVHLPLDTFRGMETQIKLQADMIADFEQQIDGKSRGMETLRASLEEKTDLLAREIHAHKQTKESLQETAEELEQTANRLRNITVQLEDRLLLLNTHRQSESTLFSQASALVNTVRATLGDIEQLHAKIERKSEVEAFNRGAIEQFVAESTAQIARLEDTVVRTFADRQLQHVESLLAQISEFQQAKTVEISTIKEGTEALHALHDRQFGQLMEAVQNATSVHAEQVGVALNEIHTDAAAHDSQAASLGQLIQQSSENIVSQLKAQREAVAAWQQEAARQFETQKQHIEDLAALARANATSLSELVADRAAQQSARQQVHVSGVEEYAANQERALAEAQQVILASVSSLVEAQFAAQRNAVTSFASSLAQALRTDISSIAAGQLEFVAKVDEGAGRIDAARCGTTAAVDSFSFAAQKAAESSATQILAVADAAQGYAMQAALKIADVQLHHAASAAKHDRAVQGLATQIASAHGNFAVQAASAVNAHQVAAAEVGSRLEQLRGTVAVVASSWVDGLGKQCDEVADFTSAHGAQSSALAEAAKAFASGTKVDAATGSTPSRKLVTFPQSLVRTRPYSRTVASFNSNGRPAAAVEAVRAAIDAELEQRSGSESPDADHSVYYDAAPISEGAAPVGDDQPAETPEPEASTSPVTTAPTPTIVPTVGSSGGASRLVAPKVGRLQPTAAVRSREDDDVSSTSEVRGLKRRLPPPSPSTALRERAAKRARTGAAGPKPLSEVSANQLGGTQSQ